jgi:hypothetical protein
MERFEFLFGFRDQRRDSRQMPVKTAQVIAPFSLAHRFDQRIAPLAKETNSRSGASDRC